jgi:hypothetical protein
LRAGDQVVTDQTPRPIERKELVLITPVINIRKQSIENQTRNKYIRFKFASERKEIDFK